MTKAARQKMKYRAKSKDIRIAQRLVQAATRHGLFLFAGRETVDVIDVAAGKVLCRWQRKPHPFFRINGVSHGGGLEEALRALVAPYDLFNV